MSEQNPDLSDQLLELALDQVGSHALVLLDAEGRIVNWLAGAEKLFGYSPKEVIGKNIAILFTSEDQEKQTSEWELNTAVSSGESEDDRWHVRKDSGRFWTSGTLTALRNSDSELIGFAKVMRNRTDQRSQVETLESRILQLQQGEELKNNFISTLAHELKNPLAAISNATHLLNQLTSPSSEMTLVVGMIRRQADFMGRMVHDLLEISRCATGKVELRRELVTLQEIVRNAVETCQPSIDQKTHILQTLMPEAPIHLNADAVRLRQVFVNLIQNAVKYTQYSGSIWLKASSEGSEAVIRVVDNGIGISPEMMPHIFDLFTQAEFAGPSQGGLGIGLSVVKDNVALHGGSVQAISDGLGKGSEFTVRLPLAEPMTDKPIQAK